MTAIKWIKAICFITLAILTLQLVSCGGNTQDTPTPTPSGEPTDAPTDVPTATPTEVPVPTLSVEELSNLSKVKEATGANSGKNGVIYCVQFSSFKNACGDTKALYDAEKFMVSLQGLLNRDTPTLFILDDYSRLWFNYLRCDSEKMLYGMEKKNIASVTKLCEIFIDEIKSRGLVVWTLDLPCTSNIAATVCGCDGYLPVLYDTSEDSLYTLLTTKYNVEVKMDLRGKFTGEGKIWDTDLDSCGSAKGDAYLWAIEKYVVTGKTATDYIAYMTDAYPLTTGKSPAYLDDSIYETYLPDQDFLIAKGAFIFDLDVWNNEVPNDDPSQPMGTDYTIFTKLLALQYERNDGEFSQCIGFPPFPYKYCVGTGEGQNHDATACEFECVEICTAYNIAVIADCPGPSSTHNCSLYMHYPLGTYSQAEKRNVEIPEFDPDKKYIAIYCGDYDAASWTANIATNLWSNSSRGDIPLAWGFNPNLAERIPMFFDWVYTTATDNDIFVAGNSGAGYVNPSLLVKGQRQHSNLDDGLQAWIDWCSDWYEQFDISISGFILDGVNNPNIKAVKQAYAEFSPDGITLGGFPYDDYGFQLINDEVPLVGMPTSYLCSTSNYYTLEQCRDWLLSVVSKKRDLPFWTIKTNITSPEFICEYVEMAQEIDPSIEVVDMYTFFAMIREQLGG